MDNVTQEQKAVGEAEAQTLSEGVQTQVRTKAHNAPGQARAMAKRKSNAKKLRREVSLG